MQPTSDLPTSYWESLRTHKQFLRKFGAFPGPTRKETYKSLLLLPGNYEHLRELTTAPAVLPEHGGNRQLSLVAGMVARLYPELRNQWLAAMVHPFVKLFPEDFPFAFECALAFLLNWLRPLFRDFPNANKQMMEVFEAELGALRQKVEALDYPLSALVAPMFVVALTDVLNRDDWLRLCDFWVTEPNEPWLCVCAAVAIVKAVEERLLKLPSVEQMSLTLRKEKNVPVPLLIERAKDIAKTHKQQLLSLYSSAVFPLPKGRYPIATFLRAPLRTTNAKLSEEHSSEGSQLLQQYRKLDAALRAHIAESHGSDSRSVEAKYAQMEGQLRQYLNEVKREHANKMAALREVESQFNEQLRQQGGGRGDAVEAVERRAAVEREIEMVVREGRSIEEMEEQMGKRVQ
jgi:hypothetical protein